MTPSDPDMTDLAGDVTRYREGAGLPSETLDEILASVHSQTIDEPPSARGQLRELSTAKRVLAVTGALVVTGAVSTLGLVRGDLTASELGLVALLCAGLGGLMLAVVQLALQGLHQATAQHARHAVLGLGLGTPLLASLLPVWPGADTTGSGWLSHVAVCGALGLISSVLGAGIVVMFQRSDRGPLWRIASAGAAGGLAGMVARTISCPAGDVAHVALAHGQLALLTAALCVGVASLRGRLVG